MQKSVRCEDENKEVLMTDCVVLLKSEIPVSAIAPAHILLIAKPSIIP
jgi:hypothetical protein